MTKSITVIDFVYQYHNTITTQDFCHYKKIVIYLTQSYLCPINNEK